MTRDEIMAMSAEELRIEIAKKKGFSNFDDRFSDGEGVLLAKSPNSYNDHVPDYPHDIAAAWELVEEMRNAGSKPGMFGGERWASVKVETSDWRWFENPGIHPNYRCIFRIKNKRCWFAEGDTAPLAICRAWLIWSEESGK